MNLQEGLQISDLIGLIRRRGRSMAWVSGLIILTVFWVVMALPNQYSSYATILVEPQSVDEALVTAGVQTRDLEERLGIMSAQILSRSRLSRMIDDFDLYADESESLQRQEVIEVMRSHLEVSPVLSELETDKRNAEDVAFNRFKVTYQSPVAATAALVAQSLANDFLDANIDARIKISQQSLEFMEDSIESLRAQAESVEAEIKEVKSENAGHLPEDLATNQSILENLIAQLRQAQRTVALANSDEAFWKSQVIAAETMTGGTDTMSPAYRRKALMAELSAMQARGYTDKHPDMAHTKQELQLVQMRMNARGQGENGESSDSYAEQNAKSEQRRAGFAVQAAQADIERLSAQLVEVQQQIAATPLVAEQLNALEREYESLTTAYLDFSARRQQAVVQANLERKQLGEQFRILESAFEAARPSSPNRILMLFVGVLLGLGVGVAAGLVLETSDSSIHDSRHLQALASMPVLASIPSIMLEPDRLARRKRRIVESAFALLVTVFFVSGGVLTYSYVNGVVPAIEEMEERIPESNERSARILPERPVLSPKEPKA